MAVEWTSDEREEVEAAMGRFPAESGYCAALARVVHRVGRARDEASRGLQVRPKAPARFVQPKRQLPSVWYSHTFVETHAHAVDALTGVDGYESTRYLIEFWRFPDALEIIDVDVEFVDPAIQDEPRDEP